MIKYTADYWKVLNDSSPSQLKTSPIEELEKGKMFAAFVLDWLAVVFNVLSLMFCKYGKRTLEIHFIP